MPAAERPIDPPRPDLEPRPITLEQYLALTPEKLELIEGYLIDGPAYAEQRRNLLRLLLVNEGLLQAVRLAPPERWQAALRQVYGEP
jgi:hypothetical protein